ncbi:MAG: hypothetical protein AAGJ18_18300 [Bacteroidota bacterium]
MKTKFILALSFCLLTTLIFGQIEVTQPNGFVGMGTINPTQRLQILEELNNGPGGSNFLVEATESGVTKNFVKAIAGTLASAFLYRDQNFFAIAPAPDTGFVGDGSTQAASLTVSGTDGKVGIGTWFPAEKLDVQGNIVH